MTQEHPQTRAVRAWIAAATALLLSTGCATGSTPVEAKVGVASSAPPVSTHRTDSRTFRIGIWEFDLLALDLEPRGATVRMLDLKIFKGLEVGGGSDYHSVSLVEIPDLLNVFTTRHEGPTYEHRFGDLQALALAALRFDKESERESEAHVLKIPVAGSFYSHEVDGTEDKHSLLYVFGWSRTR